MTSLALDSAAIATTVEHAVAGAELAFARTNATAHAASEVDAWSRSNVGVRGAPPGR